MQLPRASYSWMILAAVLLGVLIDLVAALPAAPSSPPVDEPTWSLTPADFIARQTHNKGIWPAQTPEPVITQAEDVQAWLPPTHLDQLETSSLSESWYMLSFPDMASLPMLAAATIVTAPINAPTRTTPCEHVEPQKFQCDEPGWAYVGTNKVKILGKKVECIWAHPLHEKITTITYPDIPPPPEGERFVLEVAFHDDVTGDAPNPIKLTATHGLKTASFTAQNTRRGWQRFPFGSDKARAPLALTVQASKKGRHQLCYRLSTRPDSRQPRSTP